MADTGSIVREPDVDRGPIITTALWVFTGTSVVLQIARLWGRLKLRKLGWDDYWMFLTTALLAGFATIVQVNMNFGAGRHAYYIAEMGIERAVLIAKLSWLSHNPGVVAIGTGKISVALMILRFLPSSQKMLRWAIWTCVVTANILLIGVAPMTFLQCRPTSRLWDLRVEGMCWDPNVQMRYSVFAGAYNAASDVFLALVPLAILIPLQMQMSKKLGLCVIFSLGVLAGACGFYKSSRIPGLAKRGDPTWDQYDTLLYTGSEIWLIIICGTVPALKPVWDAIFSRHKEQANNYGISQSNNKISHYEDSSREYTPPSSSGHDLGKTIAVSHTIDIEVSGRNEKLMV